jgi:hypothetical protein
LALEALRGLLVQGTGRDRPIQFGLRQRLDHQIELFVLVLLRLVNWMNGTNLMPMKVKQWTSTSMMTMIMMTMMTIP